jgi:hypothetical protein
MADTDRQEAGGFFLKRILVQTKTNNPKTEWE